MTNEERLQKEIAFRSWYFSDTTYGFLKGMLMYVCAEDITIFWKL